MMITLNIMEDRSMNGKHSLSQSFSLRSCIKCKCFSFKILQANFLQILFQTYTKKAGLCYHFGKTLCNRLLISMKQQLEHNEKLTALMLNSANQTEPLPFLTSCYIFTISKHTTRVFLPEQQISNE